MKKFIFIAMMAFAAITTNAQTAIQTSKTFDNVYVGVQGGAFTPLDFNSMFPVNGVAGLKIGKEFTPVWGAEIEGNVFFNENNFQQWTKTLVKGTNVGVNGIMNLTNLFKGYKGYPNRFEVKTNAGLGWMHLWNDGKTNFLSAKTALDFNLNFGGMRQHTVSLSPGVFWVLNPIHKIQFNKEFAQLGVMIGYTYHFKTSNNTHSFKLYDVGAMNDEINSLREELAKKPKEVTRDVVREVKVPAFINNEVVVFFAKGSYKLTQEAKEVLNKVRGTVNVYGFASPEGPASVNNALANRRAQVVADYLVNLPNNVKINACEGKGVQGETSGRVTIVTVK